MSQKYVTEGAWLVCSEGKMMQKLKVDSQTTVYMHGKLAATELDSTGENFNCLKMVMAAAFIGAVIAAAIIAITVLTGGAFVGVLAASAAIGTGVLAGAVTGTALSFMPCICSLLTKPNDWTMLHDKVYFQRKQALLENATLPCLLGGIITIVKTNIKMAIDMAMLCDHLYGDGAGLADSWSAVPDDEYPEGLRDEKLWDDKRSNFFAKLYRGPDDSYAVIFRGTQPAKIADWKNNVQQAFGLTSEQYKLSHELAKQIKQYLPANKTIIAGHSKGGAEAALAGAETGFQTYTFNAAGLHESTLKSSNLGIEDTKHIQAIGSDDDPLSMLQDNRDLMGAVLLKSSGFVGKLTNAVIKLDGAIPQAVGQRLGLDTDVNRLDPLKAHSIPPLVEVLKNEEKESPNIKVITDTK